MDFHIGKLTARLDWRQVGMWWGRACERTLFNWLNPLVWCRHENGLYFRGQPIEQVED